MTRGPDRTNSVETKKKAASRNGQETTMATQLTEAARRRSTRRRAADGPRHPAVALAMALPCAALLVVLFGGFDQLAAQADAVATLIGR
jgi:hypothetical protein